MDLVKTFIKKIELKTKLYEALNTIDLNTALQRLNASSFIGVVDKDMLMHLFLKQNGFCSLIFNLDHPDGPGSHWVAIGIKGKNILYFDSYGDSYPPEEVKVNGFTVLRNIDALQTESDPPICGHLCIAFCYLFHITKGDPNRILQEFTCKQRILKFIAHSLI